MKSSRFPASWYRCGNTIVNPSPPRKLPSLNRNRRSQHKDFVGHLIRNSGSDHGNYLIRRDMLVIEASFERLETPFRWQKAWSIQRPLASYPSTGFSKKKLSGRNAWAMYSTSFADTPHAWKCSRQVRTVTAMLSISFLAASVVSPNRSHWESRL